MLDRAVTAVCVHKRRRPVPEANLSDRAQHHIMGAESVDICEFALQRCRGIIEHRWMIVVTDPITRFEPGVVAMPQRPGKSNSKIVMPRTEHI